MTEQLRIINIQIEGLFGLYNHNVPLNNSERVSIIHGPNGIGKTALLRLVNAFVKGNYLHLNKVPFTLFQLTLSDSSIIGIRKPHNQEIYVFQQPLGGKLDEKSIKLDNITHRLDADIPWLIRADDDLWLDRRDDTVYSTEMLLTNFENELPPETRKKLFSEPDSIIHTRKNIKVHLVETQRLLNIQGNTRRHRHFDEVSTIISTVNKYAEEIQTSIESTLAKYAKISQALDQSFPQRLLQASMSSFSLGELKEQMQRIEDKRIELQRIGLLEQEKTASFNIASLDKIESMQQGVMALYAQDTAKKLSVFDDLASRLNLLLANLNQKFKNKKLVIDKKKGLLAVDENGNPLNLDWLSSGEQHELVLIYDLLFRVEPDTLVMIDEPELSLHISWQKTFLNDLLQIVKTAKFDVLLATHSPFIVGDYDELMTPLLDEKDKQH